MDRRSLLAALVTGAAALAGCIGNDGDSGNSDATPTDGSDDGDQTPTDAADDGDQTPESTADVTVEQTAVTPEIVALDSPDSIGSYGAREQQYLLAEITASGELSPDDLELAAGDGSYTPSERIGRGITLRSYGDQYFPTEAQSGWVAVEVPKPLDATSATLTWPGGEHALGEPAVGTLRRPPTSFDVTVEAPDQVEAGSSATLSVTVANTGDHRGTFVGALNRTGPSIAYTPVTAVELRLEPGESDTWEHSYGPLGDTDAEFSFKFNWRNGREDRRIAIVEGSE